MKKLVIVLIFLFFMDFAAAEACNVSISIDSNAENFDNGEKIEFQNQLSSKEFDFVIEYWIEDMDGSIIKRKINTTNTNKKAFTPKNLDLGIVIKSRIARLGCNGINFGANSAEKVIKFRGKQEESTKNGENLTHESITVTFEVEKDTTKLQNLARQIKNNEEHAQNSKITQKTNKSENKTRKYIPYFIITLTTLLSIVLVWRR